MTGNLDLGGNSIVDLAAITAGDIVLDSSVSPPTPVAGDVGIIAQNWGEIIPSWLNPDGYTYALQQSLYANPGSWHLTVPIGGGLTSYGEAAGVLDTSVASGVQTAVTDDYTRTRKGVITSAAAAIWRSAGWWCTSQATNLNYYVGDAANHGGFYFYCSFWPTTWVGNGGTLYVGLTSYNAAPMTGDNTHQTDPSAKAYSGVGLGCDSGDASVMSLYTSDGSGTTTKTAIAGIPTLTSGTVTPNYVRLIIYNAPNSAVIKYRVDKMASGVWTNVVNSSVTGLAHMPVNTTFMMPTATISSGSVIATCALSINKMFCYGLM
jgi:hypothetical protein